jgi:hypothetical protein
LHYQVDNQPEYLMLKGQQQIAQNNQQQPKLHSQVILPSTTSTSTASHQRQVPNTPQRKNMPLPKTILSPTQPDHQNYTGNMECATDESVTDIQKQQEQTIDDNDDEDDVFDLIDD